MTTPNKPKQRFKKQSDKNVLLRELTYVYQSEVKLEAKAKERQDIMKQLLQDFTQIWRTECEVFNCIFKDFYYTGSSFEGLQVKHAIEFDVNLVLDFPFFKNENTYLLHEVQNPSSFAMIQLKCPFKEIADHYIKPGISELYVLSNFFDNDNYLIPQKILSWFQSLIDRLNFRHFYNEYHIEGIYPTNSGPARTLKIKFQDQFVSIDLVPVIQIDCDGKLQSIYPLSTTLVKSTFMAKCCLVPKPIEESEYYLTSEMAARLWRIHFPEAELEIIRKRNSVKTLIKLVKCLRDKQKWPIPSYFIKIIAFWLVQKHPDASYFNESHLDARFLEMLKLMLHFMESKFLGHIFFPKFNIFQKINPSTLNHICGNIKKILKAVTRNPASIKKFFRYSKYRKMLAILTEKSQY